MKFKITFVLFTLALNLAVAQTPRVAHTEGSVIINNIPIHYKAAVEENFMPFQGDTVGSIITTSYLAEVSETHNRPIIFLFNGGPGASSSPLHMYAFGPVRLKKSQDTTMSVSNQYSLLDVADLVFIDPMGTGFTRVFKESKARDYWDVEGDARSIIEIIKNWKKNHNRESSPTFVCGESYGTIRASEMLGIAENFPVDGVLLFSLTIDFSLESPVSGNEMPYLLTIPSMTAIASYYHKSFEAYPPQKAFNAGMDFARGDYVRALFKGNSLSDKERAVVAEKLSKLIGLSKKTILDHNLRITTENFEMLLLKDENRRIGKLDARISAPLPDTNKPYSARDDPSLLVNTVMSKDAVGKYFRQQLGFSDSSLYKSVDFDVNGKWKWTSMDADLGYYSVLPKLEKAMHDNSKLRLLVAGGIYDLATPMFAGKYLLDQSSIPIDRTTFLSFPTGHSIFQDEIALAKLTMEVKNFIIGNRK
jgi:carboxypeptidase C (cathepsin A)